MINIFRVAYNDNFRNNFGLHTIILREKISNPSTIENVNINERSLNFVTFFSRVCRKNPERALNRKSIK